METNASAIENDGAAAELNASTEPCAEDQETQQINQQPPPIAPTVNNALVYSSDMHYDKQNMVAEWHVPMRGKLYKVEFEHGTTSGKRIIWVDQNVVLRRDWMFKLVGDDVFQLEDLRCVLRVNPAPGFKYSYVLYVDGKPLQQFKEFQAKALKTWETILDEKHYRVVLEKETLNIFMNGELREEEGEFVDDGTETRWTEDGHIFVLTARTSGNKREGLKHDLTVNGLEIDEAPMDG